MRRLSVFLYGLFAYVTFLGVFLYLAGFIGNFIVPVSIDSAAQGPLGTALLINTLLLTLFGIQHSVMARPSFKRWWTQFIPEPIERSTYVLLTNVALVLLFWQWRPMGGIIWDIQNPAGRLAMYGLFASGWLTVLVTTFLINHFDLFGLRQVYLYLIGKPYTSLTFKTPGPYKLVRHPLYVGWLTAFWATPTMTAAHMVFAVGMLVYILIAIPLEERDLSEFHGADYDTYRRRVPRLIPRIGGRTEPIVEPAEVAA